jgi:hypothetical protein
MAQALAMASDTQIAMMIRSEMFIWLSMRLSARASVWRCTCMKVICHQQRKAGGLSFGLSKKTFGICLPEVKLFRVGCRNWDR